MNEAGEEWVELHEDDVNNIIFFDTQPRRVMSVRAPPGSKPLIIVGQDEALYAQYLVALKSWKGPKGETVLNPKSEGDKIMLSAYTGRELGFGRPLSMEELEKINANRAGKHYLDKEAALEINKKTEKMPFKEGETPFVRYLHTGVANEGYWNSYHMALQLEDVVDCLRVLYPDCEVVMLFDHSSGHDRKRDGALNAAAMSKGFVGSQPAMRDTTIGDGPKDFGNLNPDHGLKPGDKQQMNWGTTEKGDSGRGPFNMNPDEREARQKTNQPESLSGKTRQKLS